jgi:hypothetical protein
MKCRPNPTILAKFWTAFETGTELSRQINCGGNGFCFPGGIQLLPEIKQSRLDYSSVLPVSHYKAIYYIVITCLDPDKNAIVSQIFTKRSLAF